MINNRLLSFLSLKTVGTRYNSEGRSLKRRILTSIRFQPGHSKPLHITGIMSDVMSTSTQHGGEQMTEEFFSIRGVKVPVLKLGHWKNMVPNGGQKVLMLIIPGNPGIPHYYKDFMQELYSHCDNQVPVWAIGQSGHLRPPGAALKTSDVYSTPDDLYGLEAQIAHKVAFIKENVPSDVMLILIGHSIGCYMILNMLDHLNCNQVLRCFMLFPTIERMAISPNGLRMTPVFQYLRWVLIVALWFLCLIPRSIRGKLIEWWYKDLICPQCTKGAICETLTPYSGNFSTYLAKQEMAKVTDLQKDLVKKYMDKLSFYYGNCDEWAPVQYYHELVKEFPKVDARLCNLSLKHAFVLTTWEGREMAKIVWLWAQSHHHTVLSSIRDVDGGEHTEETWVFDE